MRFLKLASAKNPTTDYILLNGGYYDKDGNKTSNFVKFNGLLCTSFQSLGISRKLEHLSIKNRQFCVNNEPDFKKYNLTIEILSNYSEYESKYNELITFIDRNKKDGFRIYYSPYIGMEIRYCLCDIEVLQKVNKLQPITLTLSQNSLWLGQEKSRTSSQTEQTGNIFAFEQDGEHYSASFSIDGSVSNYYCISFYNGIETQATITNSGYNEIPLKIRIYAPCVNPSVLLIKKDTNETVQSLQIYKTIYNGYIEINANIEENGVWYINENNKTDYTVFVNNALGSPYFYIENGEYLIVVKDENESEGGSVCVGEVFWQEEYSE